MKGLIYIYIVSDRIEMKPKSFKNFKIKIFFYVKGDCERLGIQGIHSDIPTMQTHS